MEKQLERLEKVVEELLQYRRDIYTCEMCDNSTTPATEYPCNECKRSYNDYFTLRGDDDDE